MVGGSIVSDPGFLYFVYHPWTVGPSAQYNMTHYHHEAIPVSRKETKEADSRSLLLTGSS